MISENKMFGLIKNNYHSEGKARAKYMVTSLLHTVVNTDNKETGKIINPLNDIFNT